MAVYSPGRRRAIILLILTSLLLITIDVRGNALLDGARDLFERGMRPIEDAAEVVARPVRNAWRGITQYDDLERENDQLQAEIDAMRSNDLVARGVISDNHELRALLNLESPGDFERVVASVVGQTPSNLDQIIEIDKGSDDGIRVGMPVVTAAGDLIGKVTDPVTSDRARVMLITDTNYAVVTRIMGPGALPSATTTTTTTTTTVPATAPPPTDEGDGSDGGDGGEQAAPPPNDTTTTVATTTTIPDAERETGQFAGQGVGQPPQVNLIDSSPEFGTPLPGDIVMTAGGTDSLAPAGIPIGVVSEVRQGSPTEGLIMDVDPLANVDNLEFVQIILYVSEGATGDGD